jgi:glycosyltransferase involved in cell wall biosynthesis
MISYKYKKVSIVTTCYNAEDYIEKTFLSVKKQTNKNFEYIVIDGGSQDNTKNIISKYRSIINYYKSDRDKGIYYGLHNAIKKTNFDIIIWINADDILDVDCVDNVLKIFNYKSNNNINWINGRSGYIKNNRIFSFIPYIFPNFIIKNGYAHKYAYGHIQQESTVFKKELFYKVGGFKLNKKYSADFQLWKDFSRYEKLHTFFIKIGYFRTHINQTSFIKSKQYMNEIKKKKLFIFNFNFLRLLISLIGLPYVYFKTILIFNKQ